MARTISLGSWITVPHPTIVDLIARNDFDWLCVDLEHSPVSRREMQSAVTIIQGYGKKAFVRVSQNSHNDIKFPLDSGVDGIIIPMINSKEDAEKAVASCLYPPKGNRGVGLARAQNYGFGFEDHLKKNLNDLEIILQVEHIKAVEEIDSILAMEGISGIFVGPYDLSGSMGIPGQFDHPDMISALTEVSKKTLQSGLFLGAHVINPCHNDFKKYQELGYNFVAFSIDTFFLGQKLKEELKIVRDLCEN